MALNLMYQCKCGEKSMVYVPKQKAYGESTGEPGYWQAIDAEEEADGEIEAAKVVASAFGSRFIDGRQAEDFVCSGCRRLVDFAEDLKRQVRGGLC